MQTDIETETGVFYLQANEHEIITIPARDIQQVLNRMNTYQITLDQYKADIEAVSAKVAEHDIHDYLSQQVPTPPPQAVQPIIHVNIDTGAISQALILGMKVLMEEQTKALIDGLSYTQNDVRIVENDAESMGESPVSQEVSHQPVDLSQSESLSNTKTRKEIIAELLIEDEHISGREIERRTGIPDASARKS